MNTLGTFADVTNSSFILGFLPESLDLLILGFVLIACAVSMRWIFNRQKTENDEQNNGKKA